jgi:nucleotide-binding universal stress UspA family protein
VGFPVPLLVAASSRAGLVVLGDRGLGGFTALLVGSVAIGLAARAECPVVVVRGERPSDAGPVVVGIDGSQISEAALAFAFEAAVTRKVPLIAVHSWTDSVLEAAVASLLRCAACVTASRLCIAARTSPVVRPEPAVTGSSSSPRAGVRWWRSRAGSPGAPLSPSGPAAGRRVRQAR